MCVLGQVVSFANEARLCNKSSVVLQFLRALIAFHIGAVSLSFKIRTQVDNEEEEKVVEEAVAEEAA